MKSISSLNQFMCIFPEVIDKTEIIPLGIDRKIFRYDELERNVIRKNIGIMNDGILIITSGKIQPYKHLEILLEAFSELTKRIENKKIFLVIIGLGEKDYINRLKDLIISLGISDKVIFSGWIPNNELYKWFSAADLGVWTSGPTITLREATGCSLPILIPDKWNDGESSEEFIDKENGWSFKTNDFKDLQNKLELLILKNDFLIKARKNAIEKAKDLDWKNIALRYQKWF